MRRLLWRSDSATEVEGLELASEGPAVRAEGDKNGGRKKITDYKAQCSWPGSAASPTGIKDYSQGCTNSAYPRKGRHFLSSGLLYDLV